jgi:hypothetical protein
MPVLFFMNSKSETVKEDVNNACSRVTSGKTMFATVQRQRRTSLFVHEGVI